jgi:hypothetical protein
VQRGSRHPAGRERREETALLAEADHRGIEQPSIEPTDQGRDVPLSPTDAEIGDDERDPERTWTTHLTNSS